MADPKKDPKTELAADAAAADPRDALIKKLQADLAQAAKAKADSDQTAADAADYAKELEGELKAASKGTSPEALLTQMIAGQNQLAAAMQALVKQGTTEMLRHSDIVGPDGKVPLAPEHRGTKKYRTTRPGFHGGRWVPGGTLLEVTDQKPSRTWKLITGKEQPEQAEASAPTAPAGRPSDAEV